MVIYLASRGSLNVQFDEFLNKFCSVLDLAKRGIFDLSRKMKNDFLLLSFSDAAPEFIF